MRLALACILVLASVPALAQQSPQTTFRDSRGSMTGTATTSGNQTTFRDSRGATTGTATRDSQGNTVFRDSRGATIGTSSRPR